MHQTANSMHFNHPITFNCIKKVKLFDDNKCTKNRRFTSAELETEKEIASWLRRPIRTFVKDTPFYPWLPPEPLVNFELNYK